MSNNNYLDQCSYNNLDHMVNITVIDSNNILVKYNHNFIMLNCIMTKHNQNNYFAMNLLVSLQKVFILQIT